MDNHGVYFVDGHYRNAALNLWNSLSNEEKTLVNQVMGVFRMYDFKNDFDLFLREFMAFFRDPNELETSYLRPSGFDERLISKVELISKKVKGMDTMSSVYQEMLQASPGSLRPQAAAR